MKLTEKPRVLMVTGVYPPDISGAAVQCQTLMRALGNLVDFKVLTSALHRGSAPDEKGVFRILNLSLTFKGVLSALRVIYFLHKNEFDVIHIHGYSKKAIFLIVIAKLFGLKLVLKSTSLGVDDASSIFGRGWVHRVVLNCVDLIVAPAPAFLSQDYCPETYLKRSRFIPNGVDTERFRPLSSEQKGELRRKYAIPETSFVVISVGHFSEDKGMIKLFDALKCIVNSCPDITFIVVGTKELGRYEVSERVVDAFYALRAYPIRVVEVEHTLEIERYYQLSDILVHPSTREGLPNSALEAMSTGLPVLANKLPGIADFLVVDNVNGFCIDCQNVSVLSAHLKLFYMNRGDLHRLGSSSRRLAQRHFSLTLVADEFLDLYRYFKKNFYGPF